MDKKGLLPVFSIQNFEDYNNCMEFDKNFYVRTFKEHLTVNKFIEKPHGHDFYLVVSVTKGSGTHNIDFNEYLVEPGSVFIISPGQVHNWDLSNDTDGYIVFFTREYFLLDFNQDKLSSLPFFKSTFSIPYMKLEDTDQQVINNLLDQINDEYHHKRLKHHEMIRLYLNILFIEMARLYKIKNQQHHNYSYELIQLNKFEELIDQHFKDHKGIPFYAEQMNLSLKQISYLCKKSIGKNPIEMLSERMILEAKRLLIHSDLSISAIADILNYSDNSYFIKTFKKFCGATPEQFRQSFLINNKNADS